MFKGCWIWPVDLQRCTSNPGTSHLQPAVGISSFSFSTPMFNRLSGPSDGSKGSLASPSARPSSACRKDMSRLEAKERGVMGLSRHPAVCGSLSLRAENRLGRATIVPHSRSRTDTESISSYEVRPSVETWGPCYKRCGFTMCSFHPGSEFGCRFEDHHRVACMFYCDSVESMLVLVYGTANLSMGPHSDRHQHTKTAESSFAGPFYETSTQIVRPS